MPTDACAKYGGSFQEAWLNVTVLSSTAIALAMNLFNKNPTMLGESTMLSFAPAPELLKTKAWQLDKIGTSIDPENVIDGGNQFNHGVWNGGALGRIIVFFLWFCFSMLMYTSLMSFFSPFPRTISMLFVCLKKSDHQKWRHHSHCLVGCFQHVPTNQGLAPRQSFAGGQ